jgi:hypothetical protein
VNVVVSNGESFDVTVPVAVRGSKLKWRFHCAEKSADIAFGVDRELHDDEDDSDDDDDGLDEESHDDDEDDEEEQDSEGADGSGGSESGDEEEVDDEEDESDGADSADGSGSESGDAQSVEPVLEAARMACPCQRPAKGSLQAQQAGRFVCTWDNSYSWFKVQL